MTYSSEVYDQLAQKYRLLGDTHFLEILQVLMTPEEGQYLLTLSNPMTAAELAAKLGLDEKTTSAKLDSLARRGLLFRGKTQYLAWGDAHQLKARVMFSSDDNIPPAYLDLRRSEMRYAESPYAEINLWFKLYAKSGKPLIRVIPARKAIMRNPAIRPDQILWYENIVEMMTRAEKIGVVECDCRRLYHRCDGPLWNCFHFGKMVGYEVGRGGRMKEISLEEAITLSDEAEEAGLVHNTPGNNASLSGVICNCCNDCCSTFEPAIKSGRLNEVVAPSRFRASVKQELCQGCEQCLKRCPFGAIKMHRETGARKSRALVVEDKCLGCGVCVIGCKRQAMTFDLVRPPDFIPPKPQIGQPLMYSVY